MSKKFDRSLIPAAPDLHFEIDLWQKGLKWVAGIDEAGRGALAGPVAAAAVVLPPSLVISRSLVGVRDSKEMTAETRAHWARRLPDICLACGLGFASAAEIDTHGILPATYLAARRALNNLILTPEHLLLDFIQLADCSIPQTSLVKGDARSLSIAAASILAKHARDGLMVQFEADYPGYGFAKHKGYGTLAHRQALDKLGFSPIHRRSFRWRREEEVS